jgi:hypothetical protein
MWSSCLALLLFSAAHSAMLLGGVMLLTTVRDMPPAVAGLCLAPGPVVVVLVSLIVAGRLIGKVCIGVVAATGALLYVVGIVIWLCTIGPVPDYFTDYLRAQLFTGAGVGLVMPSLSAVPGMALPSPRLGAGSALTNTARQLGMVLGTAVLTMIYQPGVDLAAVRRVGDSSPRPPVPPRSSRQSWRSGGNPRPTGQPQPLLINLSRWPTSRC